MGTSQKTFSDTRSLENNGGTRSVSLPKTGVDEFVQRLESDNVQVYIQINAETGEFRGKILD